MSPLRTRFAPSPTGELHLGGARTALFCFLLARKASGRFILRFEDTDRERSRDEHMQSILKDMNWLGLKPDEGEGLGGNFGPYRQSQRLDLYESRLQTLRNKGSAYPCFCTEERLNLMRKDQERRKLPPRYDGKCTTLSADEVAARLAKREPHVFRFRIGASELHEVAFDDLVHGRLSFRTRDLEDFILKKSDGTYPFLMVSLVDDLEMKITHILRGDDHLANTPKQILIAQALGAEAPLYGHLPLVLNEKGTPLSKREGDLAIGSLREEGFLPAAVTQGLMLLGWSPTTSANPNDAWSLDEQIQIFNLEGVSKAPARCDMQRLRSINRQHLSRLPMPELQREATRFCGALLQKAPQNIDLAQALALVREEAHTLSEICPMLESLLVGSLTKEVREELTTDEQQAVLKNISSVLSSMQTAASLEELRRRLEQEHGISNKRFFRPFRLAISGRDHGPKLADLFQLLGASEILRRLRQTIV